MRVGALTAVGRNSHKIERRIKARHKAIEAVALILKS